jgi:hypothetical protein
MIWASIILSDDVGKCVYDLCKHILRRKEVQYRLLFSSTSVGANQEYFEPPSSDLFLHSNILDRRPFVTQTIEFILPDRDLP